MALTRVHAELYLNGEFNPLATAIGLTPIDVATTGFGPDIDNALRMLGVVEDDLSTATVADGKRTDYYALLEFFFTRRAWRWLSDRADWTAGPDSARFGNQLENIRKLYEAARKKVEALGYDVEGSGWAVGWWNADYLEPSAEDGN